MIMNESQGYMSADLRMRAMPEPTATLSVTLRANDSINLTTGVVTRNVSTTDKRTDAMLRNNRNFREGILRDSRKRVARNDLSALAYLIAREF